MRTYVKRKRLGQVAALLVAACATVVTSKASAQFVLTDRFPADALSGLPQTDWGIFSSGPTIGYGYALQDAMPSVSWQPTPGLVSPGVPTSLFGTKTTMYMQHLSATSSYFGFVIGYDESLNPAAPSPGSADYLLLAWKSALTGVANYADFGTADGVQPGHVLPGWYAQPGLSLVRVTGRPTADELWRLSDDPSDAGGTVTELARANTLGTSGWVSGFGAAPYTFEIEFMPTAIRVHVNGTLELDVHGSFSDGALGSYAFKNQFSSASFASMSLLTDTDGDGFVGPEDNCENVANPGQEDADGDYIGDACDPCPTIFGTDSDVDGVCDLYDNCVDTANPGQEDTDGDLAGDACDVCPSDAWDDIDGDLICGDVDNCVYNANPSQLDADIDGVGDVCDYCPGDVDVDLDYVCDAVDNCPTVANNTQDDYDGDGLGDSCDPCVVGDQDGDTICDDVDDCIPYNGSSDWDYDGVCNVLDNCVNDYNPDQADADMDGQGDVCTTAPDSDGDGVPDALDNCPTDFNPGEFDYGTFEVTQADADFDGVGDVCDNCVVDANPDQADADLDGVGDACTVGCGASDVDNDGTTDAFDIAPCDPTIASVAFAPSCVTHGMILTEDQWPAQGDYDFNDEVLAYHYSVYNDTAGNARRVEVTFHPLAAGAGRAFGLGLALPIPASSVTSMTLLDGVTTTVLSNRASESNVVVTLSASLLALFKDPLKPWVTNPSIVNTDPARNVYIATPRKFVLDLDGTAGALALGEAPFDLFFFRTADQTWEIHRSDYQGTSLMKTSLFNTAFDLSTPGKWFVDRNGIPSIMDVPTSFQWTKENQPIYGAYPDILPWGTSGGVTNPLWWTTNVNTALLYAGSNSGSVPIGPGFVGGSPPMCVPAGVCPAQCGG